MHAGYLLTLFTIRSQKKDTNVTSKMLNEATDGGFKGYNLLYWILQYVTERETKGNTKRNHSVGETLRIPLCLPHFSPEEAKKIGGIILMLIATLISNEPIRVPGSVKRCWMMISVWELDSFSTASFI